DDVDVANHPTPGQLGRVLEGNAFETVYLTHLYPMTNDRHQEMLASVGERYDGEVVIAEDGLTVEL
ncbi:MAG: MBL fold metallo-hydrolase, partial [Halobacteriaceae archaeon]